VFSIIARKGETREVRHGTKRKIAAVSSREIKNVVIFGKDT